MNERLPAVVLEQLRQVDNLNELVTRLRGRNYPSLHLDSAVLEGEFHLTAPAAAITMQTYQHLLPGMQADAATSTERLAMPVGSPGGRPPDAEEHPDNEKGPGC